MTDQILNQAPSNDPRVAELSAWLVQQGILGQPHIAILEAYCRKLVEMGVPLFRAHVTLRALHPVYGGVGFDWQPADGPASHEYERMEQAPEDWYASSFFYMISNGLSEYRERLCDMNEPSRFRLLNDMKAKGATDYLAKAILFEEWKEGEPIDVGDQREGVIMSWMAHAQTGFSDADLALIRATFPTISLALKSATNRRMAEDLLGVYLGKDAGKRVLSGEIQRGSSQWIDAVICYFDLQGFTSMSQRIEGEALIAMLNDYFGLVVNRIEEHGGNVLKFMGDGVLAIFDRQHLPNAPHRAIRATNALDADMAERSRARAAQGLPTLDYTMALHAGQVLYGNIGGDERLDFTVIGPEVNLAARLSGMHRPLGQRVILSEVVAKGIKDDTFELISLGRYMMRGVDEPQELFTVFKDSTET